MADNKENKTIKETDKAVRKNIYFFNKKKWIMAYWFKKSRKTEFTEKYLLRQWSKWWNGDLQGQVQGMAQRWG